MSDQEMLVSAQNISKVYRRRGSSVVAVDGVSFSLATDESLAIVGESGSGKSTVARLLMGMITPTSGTIQLDSGRIPSEGARAALRRRRASFVQMVFQDPYSSLDPRQRIGDCLMESVALQSTLTRSEQEGRVEELLDQVSLDASLSRSFPRALSGGQRQRVAIARSLAARPRVLVLDEAVSALDVSVQATILDLLAKIRREQRMSFVFISHDLGVVRQISERILVMKSGRIVEEGQTEAILDSPQHPYTRLLRACVPEPGWQPQDATLAIEAYRRAE